VHQVGNNKLIDIMMHGQRNIKKKSHLSRDVRRTVTEYVLQCKMGDVLAILSEKSSPYMSMQAVTGLRFILK
jgi:hypothetical protein